jgi:ABC-type antimicrobial peptide transport system permease subunit
MGSPAARRDVIGPEADQMSGTVIMPMRMREGDDASCTNLFQVTQPTILGVAPSIQGLTDSAKGYEFSWAASSNPQAPWDELQLYGSGTEQDTIPVILDQNTAMWSLKQGGTLDSIILLDIEGQQVHFRVVGLLSNSVLQGKLLIAERNFQNLFPKLSGYRYFLISTGNQETQDKVISVLEDGWSPSGMDVTSSEEILKRLLGVQNTYISAFQALGALGLLLGTIGLVAVQLRSVLERRRELALMQAVGFSKVRIGNLLTLETAVLLGIGFLVGVGCAALALIPYVLEVGPQLSVMQPLFMLGVVFACGFLSAVLAIVLALKLPLLESLRTE